jgi:nucleoside recognition membrane protein YjiH
MVGGAIALITFGAVVAARQFLGPAYSNLWWIPVNVGIIIFAFGIN